MGYAEVMKLCLGMHKQIFSYSGKHDVILLKDEISLEYPKCEAERNQTVAIHDLNGPATRRQAV